MDIIIIITVIIIGTFLKLADSPFGWVALGKAPTPHNRVKDATILIRLRAMEQLKGNGLIL